MPIVQTAEHADDLQDLKWMGQRATHVQGLTLANVARYCPTFTRENFGANKYLDTIVRNPFGDDNRCIPVAAVSKRYALIQHREVVSWVIDGVRGVGLTPEALSSEFWMTEYGERIRFRFRVSEERFDPGDGFPMVLTAECFNSVDRTCCLEIRMTWVRLVCTNGLARGGGAVLRKIHDLVWMNRADPTAFVQDQLGQADSQFDVFRRWMSHTKSMRAVANWVDGAVAKKWTAEAAARVYHIVRTGFDGVVAQSRKCLPHQKLVSSDIEVPGACAPAMNLFHVSQALSWVAGHRDTVDDQVAWMRGIPQLIEDLARTHI